MSAAVAIRRDRGEFVAFEVGLAASSAEVEEVKQRLHDTIVNHWGSRRRSGVRWRVWCPDRASEMIDRLEADGIFASKPHIPDEMRAFVARYAATVHLVAAEATVIPPRPRCRTMTPDATSTPTPGHNKTYLRLETVDEFT